MDYLVYLALAPVAVGLLLWVVRGLGARRRSPGGQLLTALALSSVGWVVFNTAELAVPTPGATRRFAQVAYLFSITTPLLWFGFAATFAGRRDLLRTFGFGAALAIGLATAVLTFTNDLHGLIWRSEAYVPAPLGMLAMRVVHGPWFFVHLATCAVLAVGGSGWILRAYRGTANRSRRLSRLVAAGAIAPLVVNLLHVAGLMPGTKDFSPIALAFGAAAIGIGVRRYALLAYRPVSRRVLVDAMGEGMLVLDANGVVVDANTALRPILGIDSASIGARLGAVVDPGRAAALVPVLGAPAAQAPGAPARTAGVALADLETGQERFFEVRVTPFDAAGAGGSRLVLFHDVTERRAAEIALEHANATLRARNDDLDAFARTVAHDLKNPLGAIHGFAELLRAEGAEATDETRDECLDHILTLSDRMVVTVDDLLRLASARHDDVRLERLDMAAVVGRALARLAVEIDRAGATVEGVGRADLARWPVALGDAGWVEEVWTNYLANALKYGGRRPHVTVTAEARGPLVRFAVRDTGPGVPPEAQASIFRPFVRLAGASGPDGSGLGLSIVARVAERLGGAAGVESSGLPGEGAAFWIDLPAAPPDPEALVPGGGGSGEAHRGCDVAGEGGSGESGSGEGRLGEGGRGDERADTAAGASGA